MCSIPGHSSALPLLHLQTGTEWEQAQAGCRTILRGGERGASCPGGSAEGRGERGERRVLYVSEYAAFHAHVSINVMVLYCPSFSPYFPLLDTVPVVPSSINLHLEMMVERCPQTTTTSLSSSPLLLPTPTSQKEGQSKIKG
jgi:hypothetical protein